MRSVCVCASQLYGTDFVVLRLVQTAADPQPNNTILQRRSRTQPASPRTVHHIMHIAYSSPPLIPLFPIPSIAACCSRAARALVVRVKPARNK